MPGTINDYFISFFDFGGLEACRPRPHGFPWISIGKLLNLMENQGSGVRGQGLPSFVCSYPGINRENLFMYPHYKLIVFLYAGMTIFGIVDFSQL